MRFSEALESVISGKSVARSAWNGSCFIHLHNSTGYQFLGMDLQPFLMMKTEVNTAAPWTPSQSDLFSDDWVIVEVAMPTAKPVKADNESVCDKVDTQSDFSTTGEPLKEQIVDPDVSGAMNAGGRVE